jgi:hypothetical protein
LGTLGTKRRSALVVRELSKTAMDRVIAGSASAAVAVSLR